MLNRFSVGAVGKKIQISNIAPRPSISPREAIELAAWLVATAAPLMPNNADVVLEQFLKLVGDAGEGTEMEDAAAAALGE